MHLRENSGLFNHVVAIFLKYFYENKFANAVYFREFTRFESKGLAKRVVLFGRSIFRGKNSNDTRRKLARGRWLATN